MVMGCLWEAGAFAFRLAGYYDQQAIAWIIAGTLGLLLAPLCSYPRVVVTLIVLTD